MKTKPSVSWESRLYILRVRCGVPCNGCCKVVWYLTGSGTPNVYFLLSLTLLCCAPLTTEGFRQDLGGSLPRAVEPELNVQAPAPGIRNFLLRLQHPKAFGSGSRMIRSIESWKQLCTICTTRLPHKLRVMEPKPKFQAPTSAPPSKSLWAPAPQPWACLTSFEIFYFSPPNSAMWEHSC